MKGAHTGNIVKHTEPQQWVCKTKHATSNNGGPIGHASIRCKCEPEERDGKEPDGDQRRDESSFGTVNAMLLAISGIEPGLDRDKEEHDDDSDDEVEVCEIGTNVRKTIVDNENIKYSIEVEEENTVSETIVQPKE